MKPGKLVLLILTFSLVLSSCERRTHDRNLIEIQVIQKDSDLAFQFFRLEGRGASLRRRPTEVTSLSIHLPGATESLWLVESKHPTSGASGISYSAVPLGFVQLVPKTGKAPFLEEGETYFVSVESNPSEVVRLGAASFKHREKKS